MEEFCRARSISPLRHDVGFDRDEMNSSEGGPQGIARNGFVMV